METSDRPADLRSGLDRQWRDTIIAISESQQQYAGLISRGTEDEAIVSAAWLRLFRAEERQRELLRAMEALDG